MILFVRKRLRLLIRLFVGCLGEDYSYFVIMFREFCFFREFGILDSEVNVF